MRGCEGRYGCDEGSSAKMKSLYCVLFVGEGVNQYTKASERTQSTLSMTTE